MPQFTLVDQPDTLCEKLEDVDRVAIDTEFMREKTFFAELCLVQVATGENIYCVDPLHGSGMDAFWATLMQRTWIVHSGRQDIEVVYQSAARMPNDVVDTQIAAGLLGYAPQMGYATLVKELFDVDIEKSHTRADWSRRPIADAYLQYAAEDVEYLLPAYDILAERLDQLDRLSWAEEDAAQLLNPGLYDIEPGLAIDRVKGARNLRGKNRAAAARLAAWRESEALRANRPRQWIVKDSCLLEVASRLPRSSAELGEIDGFPSGLIRRCGPDILDAIASSGADENNYQPPAPPDASQKALLTSMQKLVAECAGELGLAAETVASRRDLYAIILGMHDESKVMRGWRRAVIGDRLLDML